MIRVLTLVRAVLLVPIMAVFTMVWSAMAAFFGAIGFDTGANFIVHTWGGFFMWVYGVSTKVYGAENIPLSAINRRASNSGERGVLFLFNHQSFFDVFAIHGTFTQRIRFGAKIELYKIPVLNLAMKFVGVLPITRDKREKVMQVYRNAESKFATGWSYILAPEGTRQDEPRIGRFKKGPFIFAVNAQATIVPVVVRGSYDVLSKSSLLANVGAWRRTIEIHVLPRIETRGMSLDQVPALVEQVHKQMLATYESGL